ncbi:MAG: response regulator [Bacteroidota bacterium]
MDQLYIICVDDQQEVLNALEQDLSPFDEKLNVEVCDSGHEVLELIDDIDERGDLVAVVISDQVMPEMSGVELLKKVENDSRLTHTRKVLLTGQATHQDTIEAINLGGIDRYIAKPWDKTEIRNTIKTLLADYVTRKGVDYSEFMDLIDQKLLYEILRKQS